MSLVLVSPSTESWFQVRAAAGRSRSHRTSGATGASVRMTESIVAMFGWIIPTPLAMPVTVIGAGTPSSDGRTIDVVATFVTESVVRSASAAASRPASSSPRLRGDGIDPGRDPIERQTRADDPGREVEDAASRRRRAPSTRGRPTSAWSRSPASPVAAFAQPLVDTIAEAKPNPPRESSDVAARLARDSRTGAAANALGVKTAAAAAGPEVARMSATSGRPEALIPAAVAPAWKPWRHDGAPLDGGPLGVRRLAC